MNIHSPDDAVNMGSFEPFHLSPPPRQDPHQDFKYQRQGKAMINRLDSASAGPPSRMECRKGDVVPLLHN
jgi:hypothetical protein